MAIKVSFPSGKSVDLFKRKAKEPPPRGMAAFFGRNPVWTTQNITALTEAGYKNCMTIYRGVSLIGKAAAGIPWMLSKKSLSRDGKDEKLFDHALLDLIKRPNEFQGQSAFIEGMAGFFHIAGNSYVLGVGPEGDRPPKELHWLFPHYVHIEKGDSVNPIKEYVYKADPTKPLHYDPQEVLHLKTFHPLDFFYGLSPLSVAARGIDILNMALFWNMKLLQNDMRPPGGIIIEGTLTPGNRKILKENIKESYGGYENAATPIVLEGGQDWKPFAITPRDADWLNSMKQTVRFVCVTLGIAPELMGDGENKTYSNQKEARKGLYEETVLPFMDYMRDEFNNWLTPKFGDRLYLDYNRDAILALKEDRSAVFDRAQKSTFLMVNEKRKMTGHEEIPEGNVILVPISMIPLGVDRDTEKGSKALERKSANKSFWTVPERKEALWNNFVILVKAKEKSFKNLAVEYMRAQAKRIEKELKKVYSIDGLEPEAIFNIEDEAKEYQKKLTPWYVDAFIRAGQAGIMASKGELYDLEEKDGGPVFDLTPELEELLQQMVFNCGTKVNETMIDIIYRTIQRAMKESWTVEDLTQMISHQVDEFMPWRSRLWARDQTAKTENWGQVEGYKQTEFVEKKGWLSMFAPESRDSHMAADGQVVGLDEPFDVGGESMMFPGDNSMGASVGNTIQCLCATFPEVIEL